MARSQTLPPLPTRFEYRLDLAEHVTPRLLKDQPIHRWFYFPHSFSPQLVKCLLDEWKLPPKSLVLDPFIGAGTTMLATRDSGFDALGVDLSPLSVFVSNTKIRSYDSHLIEKGVHHVKSRLSRIDNTMPDRTQRLKRAFTDQEYAILVKLRSGIQELSESVRDFFLLALLRVQQNFSRAVPDGGWFRWRDLPSSEEQIWPTFEKCVENMLLDTKQVEKKAGYWKAIQHDARYLVELKSLHPRFAKGCQAMITSPPYPNRHDYSRIFQIELLNLGLSEQEIFILRHQSLRSHVEAKPPDGKLPLFCPPKVLQETISQLPEKTDRRILSMLQGYFEDMNAVLHSAYQVLVPGGRVALVVGNVRHAGIMIPVDTILAQIAENQGFTFKAVWVARLRGNSAQQMGTFGRIPARESIILLYK